MLGKKIICAVLSLALFCASAGASYADVYDDLSAASRARSDAEEELQATQGEIENAKAGKAAREAALFEAEERISALQQEKDELQAYLDELRTQLSELDSSLAELAEQISTKQTEIEMSKAAVERAKLDEAEQYTDMKARIQYMYECGNQDFFVALMDSSSLTDFLNKAQHIEEISSYDREKLDEYGETKEAVEDREKELEEEEQELRKLQAEDEAKQAELTELAETTDGKIAEYLEKIGSEECEASGLQQQIEAHQEYLAELTARAEAQEAARAEAARQEEEALSLAKQKEEEEKKAAEEAAKKEAEEKARLEEEEKKAQEEAAAEDTEVAAGSARLLGTFKLTAYCHCAKCCGRAGHPTASGVMPTVGRTVAMAGVPFGTKLLINGRVYTVEDRGTPYGHVDIFMSSHEEALIFGLQYAEVYIVG